MAVYVGYNGLDHITRFTDNFTTPGSISTTRKHFKVTYLPVNTISFIQQCDHGIIMTKKTLLLLTDVVKNL